MAAFDTLCEQVPTARTIVLKVLHDGPLSENREWTQTLEKALAKKGELIERRKQGNNLASLQALADASSQPADEVVIMAEDDYLWLAPALIEQFRAITSLPCDYATVYDHPLIYEGLDYPHWYSATHLTKHRHWTAFESTCMTFASTAGVIKSDFEVFKKHHTSGLPYPDDREFFREVQGLGPYQVVQHLPSKLLLGSVPALATHVHLPHLAPLIDWEQVAVNDKSLLENLSQT
jgi:hypothetical protein